MIGPRNGKPTSRIEDSSQNVDNSIASFVSKKPSRQNSLRPLNNRRYCQRSARRDKKNDWFANIKYCLRKFQLPPRQPRISATSGFSTHICGFAHGQENNIRPLTEFERQWHSANIVAFNSDPFGVCNFMAG